MEPPRPQPVGPQSPQTGSRSRPLLTVGAFVAAIALVAAAIWVVPKLAGAAPDVATASSLPPVSGASIPPEPSLSSGDPAVAASLPPATAGPPIELSNGRTLAEAGALAIVSSDNSLSLVDPGGRTVVLAPGADATFAFPAWSPDGSRLAAIRTDAAGSAIIVFDAKRALAGEPVKPTAIFRSSSIGPFYLAWTPDGKNVSFLADDADGLSLRLAPADGKAPLDGSGPGSKIRSGNPFYFDWIGADRLLAHVGSGPEAFLGVIGLDGSPVGPPLATPGDFRPAVVNHDGTYISYVQSGSSGRSAVVVASQDGSDKHSMPVFGMAGMTFGPDGNTLASIGPTATREQPLAIPVGPLRLMDARTGKVRQLLDGDVVSFWWSPDGKTIAALRVQPIARAPGGSAAPPPSAATASSSVAPGAGSSGSPAPSTPPTTEARLLFVDVASGHIGAQSVIQPSNLFIDQFLTFFDQYATSHRIWAPDSSSLIVPVSDFSASPRLALIPRNGDPRLLLDGEFGFWSP